MQHRSLVLSLALVSAAALSAHALTPDETKNALIRIDAPKIGEHVTRLTGPELHGRRAGTPGARLALDYLAKAFADAGLEKLAGESSFVVKYDAHDCVLGRVPGTDRASEAIVVSAHWDGVGQDGDGHLVPGADENGSGLAALLEIARTLGKSHPRRTIVLAAFGGWWDAVEDSPRFRGAKAFVKKYSDSSAGMKPIFAVNLMTLGVPLIPSAPERFFALGSETSQVLKDAAKEIAAETTDLKLACASIELIEKRGPRDDYDAFRAAGVPFLFLTSGVSRYYHKAGDVPSTVDPKRIAAAARVAVSAIARIDAADAAPAFAKEPLRDDRVDANEVLALMDAALDPKAGVKMSETERKALTFKREKVKDLTSARGPLSARDRGTLKDSLELLLLLLTR